MRAASSSLTVLILLPDNSSTTLQVWRWSQVKWTGWYEFHMFSFQDFWEITQTVDTRPYSLFFLGLGMRLVCSLISSCFQQIWRTNSWTCGQLLIVAVNRRVQEVHLIKTVVQYYQFSLFWHVHSSYGKKLVNGGYRPATMKVQLSKYLDRAAWM